MKAGDEHLLYLLQLIRENPTAFPVPGLGLGASDRARRWASLGMIIDNERFWPLVENAIASYGLARVRTHSQNMTTAARAQADMKMSAHLS